MPGNQCPGTTPTHGSSCGGPRSSRTDPPRLRLQKLARITLDSMVQFVGLLDAEGTVLEINKVALDAVGITLADVEGKPFWTTFWWQVSEEINQGIRDAIARAAKGEFVRWDTPIYASADGSVTIIIDASLMPVMDDDGKVVFICAEGRDITEKKAQEREIAQKNIELQGLLERIRELDEIKTQFFANVSHELRTPLALILGPAQRLIDDDGTMSLAQRRESAQVVARNARMLLKHVNDLLDMSKIEARKLKIELQDTDVAALVRFLASHFAVLAADRRIEYVVDADGPCVAAVDPDKLQRVVMNLLGNAFKFVPAGGRIRCSLRHSARGADHRGGRLRPGRDAGAAPGDLRALPAGRRRHQPHGGRHGSGAGDREGVRRDAQGADRGPRLGPRRRPLPGHDAAESPRMPAAGVRCRRPGSTAACSTASSRSCASPASSRRQAAPAGAGRRRPAARARRRRQPRHEPLRHAVPEPPLRRGLGVRRPRRAREGAAVRPDARRVRHHDAARERRRDDRRDAGAPGAAARRRSCCSRRRRTKS